MRLNNIRGGKILPHFHLYFLELQKSSRMCRDISMSMSLVICIPYEPMCTLCILNTGFYADNSWFISQNNLFFAVGFLITIPVFLKPMLDCIIFGYNFNLIHFFNTWSMDVIISDIWLCKLICFPFSMILYANSPE